jgi:hypothetical protein
VGHSYIGHFYYIQWAIIILGVFVYSGRFFLFSVDNLYRGFSFVFIGRFFLYSGPNLYSGVFFLYTVAFLGTSGRSL